MILLLFKLLGHAFVYGDGHVTTYDGKEYDYPGLRRYTFTQDDSGLFAVELDRCACKEKDCFMNVLITFKAMPIMLAYNNYNFSVLVNGLKANIPFISNRGFSIGYSSSIFLSFKTIIGFDVLWDGRSRLYVNAPDSFKNKMSGLAGDFNLKSIDDFKTSNKDFAHFAVDFANSWTYAQDNCSLIDADFRLTNCEKNHQVASYAKTVCSQLLSSKFSSCHKVVDPSRYVENCLEDVCGCNGRQECLCDILTAYSRQCSLNGVILKGWRNGSDCGKLLSFTVYV